MALKSKWFRLSAVALAGFLLVGYALLWNGLIHLDAAREEAFARWRSVGGDAAKLRPTAEPFSLLDYLSDVSAPTGSTTDLRPLIAESATKIPGILSSSAIQIQIGERGKRYSVEFRWNTARESASLDLRLYDRLSRPIGQWSGSAGETAWIDVEGGPYNLELANRGLLGKDFALFIAVKETAAAHRGAADAPIASVEIPTLDIQMTPASFKSWETMRVVALDEIRAYKASKGQAKLPASRVAAMLAMDGAESAAAIGLVGVGDPIHVGAEAPSFNVRVRAGPLLRGMSAFKLTHVELNTLFLDFAVGSLLRAEGVLLPRQMLVSVRFNGRELGLYTMEETQSNKGFFEGIRRSDGQLTSADGQKNYLDKGSLTKRSPLQGAELMSPEIVRRLNTIQYAKALALMSRFEATHALGAPDHRIYRSALIEMLEPWVKDLNVGTWRGRELTSEIMSYGVWWLRYPIMGTGGVVHPKTFPDDFPPFPPNDAEFAEGPASIRFQSSPPIITSILRSPETRLLFDQYLLYAADDAMQRRLAKRLSGILSATRTMLDKETRSPRTGEMLNYANEADRQVVDYGRGNMAMLTAIKRSQNKAIILVDEQVQKPHPVLSNESNGEKIVTIYNLSPFSALIELPAYARVVTGSPTSRSNSRYFLAPSDFFLAVTPIFNTPFIERAPEDLTKPEPLTKADGVLTPQIARRIFAFDRARYDMPTAYERLPSPLMAVSVPFGRSRDFLQYLRTGGIRIAGVIPIPENRVIAVGTLGAHVFQTNHPLLDSSRSKIDIKAVVSSATPLSLPPDQEVGRDIPFSRDVSAQFNGYTARVDVQFSKPRASSLSILGWIKLDTAASGSQAILDIKREDGIPCALSAKRQDEKRWILVWRCAGGEISADFEAGVWTQVALSADSTLRTLWLKVGGDSVRTGTVPMAMDPVGKVRGVVFGGSRGGDVGPFVGQMADFRFYPEAFSGTFRVEPGSGILAHRDEPSGPSGKTSVPNPSLVLMPLTNAEFQETRHMQFLAVNTSAAPITVDLGNLVWRRADNSAIPTKIMRVRVVSSAMDEISGNRLTLRPGDAFQPPGAMYSPSAWFWPGVLNAALWDPVGEGPHAVLIDVDFDPADGSSPDADREEGLRDFAWTDASKLLSDDAATNKQLLVAVVEPKLFNIPTTSARLLRATEGIAPDLAGPDALIARGDFQAYEEKGTRRLILQAMKQQIYIEAPMSIPAGYTVRIGPGTTIRFAANAGILSFSPIEAVGDGRNPVRFIPADVATGWVGIGITNAASASTFRHVEYAGARGGFLGKDQISGGLSIYGSPVLMKATKFRDLMANDGIHLMHAVFEIDDVDVDGTASDAIDMDWSFGTIRNTRLRNCGVKEGGDCLDFTASRAVVHAIDIVGASDKGISIGEESIIDIEGVSISNVIAGIAMKDGSIIRVSGCDISNAKYGLLRYIKKPYYGYPDLIAENCAITKTGVSRKDESNFIWTDRYN